MYSYCTFCNDPFMFFPPEDLPTHCLKCKPMELARGFYQEEVSRLQRGSGLKEYSLQAQTIMDPENCTSE